MIYNNINDLKSWILSHIYQNTDRKITGQIGQDAYIDIIDTLYAKGISTFSQDLTPTALILGDLWWNGNNSTQTLYRWSGTDWDVLFTVTPVTPTTPAGNNTEVQFNNNGAFGASGNLTWNNSTNELTASNIDTTSLRSSNATTTTQIDLGSSKIYDNTHIQSIDFNNRTLYDNTGLGEESIDYGNRTLNDNDSLYTTRIDWKNGVAFNNGAYTFPNADATFPNMVLGSDGNASLNWVVRNRTFYSADDATQPTAEYGGDLWITTPSEGTTYSIRRWNGTDWNTEVLYLDSGLDSTKLNIDQTVPQTTVGTFTFPKVSTPIIKPSVDSTTALKYTKADGVTSILNIDSTNSRLGIGTSSPVSQITQKSTALEETPELGSEITDANSWTSVGWTGYYATGFTHTVGNTTALSRTMTTSNGQKYQISVSISGVTSGSINILIGGSTSYNITTSTVINITAVGNGNLIFIPTSTFNGTISNISAKLITTATNAIYSILDSNGISSFEIRNQLNTLGNTYVGKDSGGFNTFGNMNAAVGNGALKNNTSGNNQTAIGAESLFISTTSLAQTAVGFRALNNSNANYNTAVGYASLLNVTNGNNTAVGANAGRFHANGVTALTTANNSVYIGYNALGFNNSDNNTIVIGASAIGLGANTTMIGTSATVTTALYGKLGIGTTSPQSTLDVNGGIRCANDTDIASATKVGTLRYRVSGNNSYVDMCMQTGASTYAWTEIVRQSW